MQTHSVKVTDNAKSIWQQCLVNLSNSSLSVSSEFQHQAERVFTLSEFVAKQCFRNPNQLLEVIKTRRLEQCLTYQQMEEILLLNIAKAETE